MNDLALDMLGRSLENVLGHTVGGTRIWEALAVVGEYVEAYTRGQGFGEDGNPNDHLAAVIITATARLLASPSQMESKSIGSLSMRYRPFQGFTVGELQVMNRYRQRTA